MTEDLARKSSSRAMRARGATLVEYLIAIALFALLALGAIALFSKDLSDTFRREGECVRSLGDCAGGAGAGAPGKGGLPGVGPDASGSSGGGGAAQGGGEAQGGGPPPGGGGAPGGGSPPAGDAPPGPWRVERTGAASPDGTKKFFTVEAVTGGSHAEVGVAAADLKFQGPLGETGLKLFSGKAQVDTGGAKVEGSMVEVTTGTTLGGVKVEGSGKHMAGEAGYLAGCGAAGCGVKGSASGWVFKGELNGGEMDKGSSGNLKVGVTGSVFGAGAEGGITTGDADADGHPELEATLKLGLVAGAGLTVRYESPGWFSRWMGWTR